MLIFWEKNKRQSKLLTQQAALVPAAECMLLVPAEELPHFKERKESRQLRA